AHFHDSTTGRKWTVDYRDELSNAQTNAETCRVDYHWIAYKNDQVLQNRDAWIPLKLVKDVQVMTMDQDFNEAAAAAGHREQTATVDPKSFTVRMKRSDGAANDLYFTDESQARKLANEIK